VEARGVVALIDWRRGGGLAENRRLLARAAAAGRVRPRGWRAAGARWRTLAVLGDGTLEFGRFAVAATARRVAAASPREGRIGKRG